MQQKNKYFTNLDTSFKETKKIEGVLTQKDNISPRHYSFMKEGASVDTYLFRLNSLTFFTKRYFMFSILYVLLFFIFLLSSPSFAIITFIINFLFYLLVRPFSSPTKISRAHLMVKGYGILSFVISGYYLMSRTMPYGEILNVSQGLLYSFMFTFITFHFLGILNKYKEIYLILDDSDEDPYYTSESIFLWKS